MLTIKNYLDKSNIHGIGLFADEDIPKGTVVWEFRKHFDYIVPIEEYENLDDIQKIYWDTYSYVCKLRNVYMISIDNDRFMNHSEDWANVGYDENYNYVARKDISIGEEILADYRDFIHKDYWEEDWFIEN
jgi:SET domain-containing protein